MQTCDRQWPRAHRCRRVQRASAPRPSGAPGPAAILEQQESSASLFRLLDALSAIERLPPVFVKIRVPADVIERIVRITDAYPFVRGFRINTIAPRPYVGLATPRERWEAMAGSLSSPGIGFPAMLHAVPALEIGAAGKLARPRA